jgi:tetratricopeptide (TPR) repeat protein
MAREAGLGEVKAATALDFARRLERRPWRSGVALVLAGIAAAVALWPRPADPLGEWARREEALTRELERNPARTDLLLDRSDLRLARSDFGRNRGRNPLPDFAQAEADLGRVLELDPGSKAALARRGRVRVQRAVYKIKNGVDPMADLAAAEEDLLRGGERIWLGNARFHRGFWELRTGGDSRADFEAAERDFAGSPGSDSLMRLGRVRAYLGKFGQAEQDFARSLELTPGSVWGWTWRANARLAAGDAAGAESYYSRALETDREFAEAWEGRGHARLARGRAADAVADFEEAIRLNPSLGPTLASLLEEARGKR